MTKYMRPPDYCTIEEFEEAMKPSLKAIAGACKEAEKINNEFLLKMFKGIPVMVDSNLEGKSYYIAVSQGLFDFLKDNADENTNKPDKDRA